MELGRRRFTAAAAAAFTAGCLDPDDADGGLEDDGENDTWDDDTEEGDADGEQESSMAGEGEVLDEEFHVDSPYGENDVSPRQLVVAHDDEDGSEVEAEVKVYDDDSLLYEVVVRLEPIYSQLTDFEIQGEGEYRVEVEADGWSTSDTWPVRKGYGQMVVDVGGRNLGPDVTTGAVSVHTPDSAPGDEYLVGEDELSSYPAVEGAVGSHHDCERGEGDEDCETEVSVSGGDWADADDLYEDHQVYRGDEHANGVYVEYSDEVYLVGLTTDL